MPNRSNKANYGNAGAGDILSGKTALVGGKKVTGTMPTVNIVNEDNTNATNIAAGALSSDDYSKSYVYLGIPKNTYTGNAKWVRASYSSVASAIGLTKEKLIKGQSVLGITGTGETGYSSCSSCCPTCPTCPTCLDTSDATATERDISLGKTAYVNGSKITGKGIQGKTYEFNRVEATSSKTFQTGTWSNAVNLRIIVDLLRN